MALPIIGLNMDYTVYPKYPATDPHFRDCYDIYAPYIDGIAAAGGLPLPIPPVDDRRLLGRFLALLNGFVFTGGEDYPPQVYGEQPRAGLNLAHPRRVRADIELARRLLASDLPILGICGGLQLINIAQGGKLLQHLDSADRHRAPAYTRDAEHAVTLPVDSRLAELLRTGALRVNSAHHQAVDPEQIGAGLRVAASAPDGVIEALEAVDERFLIGVQWHPERMPGDRNQRRLFEVFIGACGREPTT